MKEKYVESIRGKTYYWISKHQQAICLCFLPGLTANHHLFDQQVSYFKGKYSILTWDAPAHGKSRPYTDFTYSHLAEELKRILDTEDIKQVILIGQSAGGFVAQSFISRYPEMVKGLFTIGSCPYGTNYYSKSDLFWLKQTKWMFNLYPDKFLRSSIAKMCCTTNHGRKNMLEMLNDYSKTELCRLMYLGFAGFIPEICDLNITCPVELSVGENDHTGKVMHYNKMWHEQRGFPFHIIKNASHNANVDQAEEMNRLIYKFIKTIE